MNRKGGIDVHLRFRNSSTLSISVMYSKPASISCVASLRSFATLHVKLSFVCRNSALSRLM